MHHEKRAPKRHFLLPEDPADFLSVRQEHLDPLRTLQLPSSVCVSKSEHCASRLIGESRRKKERPSRKSLSSRIFRKMKARLLSHLSHCRLTGCLSRIDQAGRKLINLLIDGKSVLFFDHQSRMFFFRHGIDDDSLRIQRMCADLDMIIVVARDEVVISVRTLAVRKIKFIQIQEFVVSLFPYILYVRHFSFLFYHSILFFRSCTFSILYCNSVLFFLAHVIFHF